MKKFSVIIALLISTSFIEAQYLWDYGVTLGGSNYLGDIGGTDEPRKDFVYDMKLKHTRWVAGVFVRRRISRSFNLKLAGSYGRISGDDQNTNYAPRRARNLNFRNDIKELSLQTEFTLYSDNDFGGRGLYNPNFRVYGLVGIAGYMHSPIGEYRGDNPLFVGGSADLRELRTEGQIEEYDVYGLSIPMGFGFYFTYNRKYRFGWEMAYRLTFTDYLDDISTEYALDSELGDDPKRIAYANQTTPEIIGEVWPNDPEMIWQFDYASNFAHEDQRNPRGISENKDGYLYMNLSAGLIIQKRSKSFKAKKRRYGWLKGKVKKGRKSRAKF